MYVCMFLEEEYAQDREREQDIFRLKFGNCVRIAVVESNERFKLDGGYVKWAQWDSEYYTDFNLPRPVRL